MKKIIIVQFIILLGGTIFAWSNFGIELNDWLNERACSVGCSAVFSTNPFLTPCFYGAVFFLVAFVLSAFILRIFNKDFSKFVK